MTVLEVIQRSAEFLSRKGVDSPRLQVELLLAHVLRVPRLRLYLDFDRPLAEADLEAVRQLVKRRAAREPLQHLVGSTSFCGIELLVNRNVLVPRPETEVLAEQAWEFLSKRATARPERVTALDFGTGSGCLAIALARHVPNGIIVALDVSAPALEVARQNAERAEVSARIQFVVSDGFAAVPAGTRFDLIVSNPPYLPSKEIDQLAPEVRDHDPRLALDGGSDGLSVMRRLAMEAPAFLVPDGVLLGEFGDGQSHAVRALFADHGWHVAEVLADLSGRERILVAHRGES